MTAKSKAKKKTRPQSRKHREKASLPGMEQLENKKVHDAALHYADMCDTSIAASREKHEAHDTLLAAMIEAGLTDYAYDGLTIHIDSKQKCKVMQDKESKNGEAEEGGE